MEISFVRRVTLVGLTLVIILVGAGLAYFGYYGRTPPTTSVTTSNTFISSSTSTFTSTVSSTTPSSLTPGPGWTTYHRDNSRSGDESSASLNNVSFGWNSAKLDGLVYAEPLVFGGSVFVATENNSVYALDARTGTEQWRTLLGSPVTGSSLPCGDINPTGITGTPVIDTSTNTIYVVAFLKPLSHVLVALDSGTGNIRFKRGVDPQGANPAVQQQRAALSLANGMVYVPFGGLYGDCGQYHGWVVGISADGSGAMISYQVPTTREGGIWATSGAAIDSAGNVYITSGNGASSGNFDYGNSVIKLSPQLEQLGFFAPSNWLQLNQGDVDLGSVGPTLVGSSALFQIGKEGVGYLIDTGAMSGIGSQLFSAKVCSGAYGGTASSGAYVFVPCTDGLFALHLSGSAFTLAWKGSGFNAGPPVVTGNWVWSVDVGSGTIHAFNITDGKELYSHGLGSVTRFTTPASGEGRLFVAAGNEIVSFVFSQ
ncbi:MAG: PQQ-binding-like beta-propeller repeat protein [Thaumarchaeota archaeon]|nr:PQQ-binding-like beta-propeller repeat protein [Nitrososphaerota archaeon]